MTDRLDGLRHDSIVSSNHQDDDVGYARTARPHRRKCLMPRCIEKRNTIARVELDLISPDVLSDSTGLARDDVGFTKRVEQ